MFSSKPAPFQSDTHCSTTDTHAWCNQRGYGNTLYEHSLDANTTTQPAHRLETIHQSDQPCLYLNQRSLAPQHSPQVKSVLNASCTNDGTVPNWCVPASDNLEVQHRMFETVPYDTTTTC